MTGGNRNKAQSSFFPRHRPIGSATECDGLEDFPFARKIGNASRLAPIPRGKAPDRIQDQASNGAAWRGSESKRHLHFFKELFPLSVRKTKDEPSEGRQ